MSLSRDAQINELIEAKIIDETFPAARLEWHTNNADKACQDIDNLFALFRLPEVKALLEEKTITPSLLLEAIGCFYENPGKKEELKKHIRDKALSKGAFSKDARGVIARILSEDKPNSFSWFRDRIGGIDAIERDSKIKKEVRRSSF